MISHNQPEAGPSTRIYHTVIPSPLPSSPSFVFQLTRLRDTLMIWVGTGAPTSELTAALTEEEGEGEGAKDGEEIGKRLAADWAVATPSRGNIPLTSTSLFQPGPSSLAAPMSQRLARKFPPNQIHLSLSIPPSLNLSSGPSLDPMASRFLLMMEKKLVDWLQDILANEIE